MALVDFSFVSTKFLFLTANSALKTKMKEPLLEEELVCLRVSNETELSRSLGLPPERKKIKANIVTTVVAQQEQHDFADSKSF